MSIADALPVTLGKLPENVGQANALNGPCHNINGEVELNGDVKHRNSLVTNGVADHYQHNKPKHKFGSDVHLYLPFPLLSGETVKQQTVGNEAHVTLTNFRLFVSLPQCFHNIPVGVIEYVEMRDLLSLQIYCKDGKIARINFDSADICSEWWRHITSNGAIQSKAEDLFAFKYYHLAKANPPFSNYPLDSDEFEASMYVNDVKRMGFNIKTIWRTTEINSKFEISKTYPKFHIVPAWVSDDDLRKIAQFRSLRRFPSVVWRSKTNGAVIVRSSQPELGWFGWRCEEDEHLLSSIAQAANLDSHVENHNMSLSVTDMAATTSNQFLLLDARSYPAAVANRAKGGGCECQEYYPNCDIQFMGLPNIHAIRKSFQSVRALCLLGQEQTNWYSALEATRWLHYLSGLIRSTLIIVEAIDVTSRSTLVHCSDGWDRTAQLVSLSELLLDPYYRTIKGFRVLIEREWLEFGHKFADRCGHNTEKDLNERSPVFLQWLDAVHQCMKQFPDAFEFNEFFLVKLVHHVYSCLFGTFLCNTVRERRQLKLKSRTFSVWDLLLSSRNDFVNFLYDGINRKVLYPSYHIRCLTLWETVFMAGYNFAEDLEGLSNFTKCTDFTDSGNFTASSAESAKKMGRSIVRRSILEQPRKLEVDIEIDDNNSSVSCPDVNINSTAGPPKDETNGDIATNHGIHNGDRTANQSSSLHNGHSAKLNNSKNSDSPNVQSGQVTIANTTDILQDDTDDPSHVFDVGNQTENRDDAFCSNGVSEKNVSSSTTMDADTTSYNKQTNELENITMSHNSYDENFIPKNENLKDTNMSDSVRTLTDDVNEPIKSFDDLCVNGRSGHPFSDPDLMSLQHHSNGFRRVHSSPDSPNTSRLQRTKSVPDVMTSSLCVTTDVAKQYQSLDSDQKQRDLYKDLSRYIDSDGLTLSYSFIDKKLINIHNKHSVDLVRLQKRLEMERRARIYLQQQQGLHDGASYLPPSLLDNLQDDMLSLPDSANGERSSLSSISNDDGWEQVQFDDVQPTRWMPDHVTTCCTSCACPFTVIYRKHHCRKCGGIFCDTCSNYKVTVPDEQLFTPVRVCARCYEIHTKM